MCISVASRSDVQRITPRRLRRCGKNGGIIFMEYASLLEEARDTSSPIVVLCNKTWKRKRLPDQCRSRVPHRRAPVIESSPSLIAGSGKQFRRSSLWRQTRVFVYLYFYILSATTQNFFVRLRTSRRRDATLRTSCLSSPRDSIARHQGRHHKPDLPLLPLLFFTFSPSTNQNGRWNERNTRDESENIL